MESVKAVPSVPSKPPRKRVKHEEEELEPGMDKTATKRLKGLRNCAECRRMKLKCDRGLPCSSCVKRGVAVTCPNGVLSVGKAKRLILASTEELHARISALEGALAASHAVHTIQPHPLLLESLCYVARDKDPSSSGLLSLATPAAARVPPPPALSSSSSTNHSPPSAQSEDRYDHSERSYPGPKPSASGEPPDEFDEFEEEETTEIDQETVGKLTLRKGMGGDSSYFGGAAGPAFRIPRRQEDVFKMFNPDDNHNLSSDYPFTSAPMEIIKTSIPDPATASRLCDIYWSNVSWMADIVSRKTFETDYIPSVYAAAGIETHPHKLAVFFMILSLGSLFDLEAPPFVLTVNKMATEFYALARASLASASSVSIEPASIAQIQAILLMGSYLMSGTQLTFGLETFWPLLGLAVRAAQAVGLHRDGSLFNLSEFETNERRTVFWELYSLDSLISQHIGRPRAFSDFTIDTQLPHMQDDIGFHVHRYRFLQIVGKLVDDKARCKPRPYKVIMELDQEIRDFQNSLPPQLRNDYFDSEASTSEICQRGIMITTVNETVLSLHREYFTIALRDHPEEPLKSRYGRSYVAALEACKCLVLVVQDNLRYTKSQICQMAPRFWQFWLSSYSAAIALAANCIRSPKSTLSVAAFQVLDLAVQLFAIARPGQGVRVCRTKLVTLRDLARESICFSVSSDTSEINMLMAAEMSKRPTSPTATTPSTFAMISERTTYVPQAEDLPPPPAPPSLEINKEPIFALSTPAGFDSFQEAMLFSKDFVENGNLGGEEDDLGLFADLTAMGSMDFSEVFIGSEPTVDNNFDWSVFSFD